jgi:hypothetical protein
MSPSPSHRIRVSRFVLAGCLLLPVLTAAPALEIPGDEKPVAEARNTLKGKEAEQLTALKLEVDALEKLYHLELNHAQLAAFGKLAEKTSAKKPAPREAKAGAEYRQVLKDLRDALVAEDEDRILERSAKLDDLHEKETIEIDEEFEMTDAAIKAAPRAFKLLSAAQIVAYLSSLDDEVPDPAERILSAVEEGEELGDDEWKTLRDETAEEVSWLTAGFNADRAKDVAKAVTAFLDRGHRFKGEQLKKEWPALEKSVQQLVGNVSSLVVLQHYMERELAELLSNPQTTAALRAWIKERKE